MVRELGNDSDVLKMVKSIKESKEVDIYTEHWKSNVGTYLAIPSTCNVVIEELPDERDLANEIEGCKGPKKSNEGMIVNKIVNVGTKVDKTLETIVNEGIMVPSVDKALDKIVNEGTTVDETLDKTVNEDIETDHADVVNESIETDPADVVNESIETDQRKGKGPAIDELAGIDFQDDFDPFFGLDMCSEQAVVDEGTTVNEGKIVDEGTIVDEGKAMDENDMDEGSEDGEFTLDAGDIVDEVEVDMRELIDEMLKSEAMDMDDFESNSDESDLEKERKTLLRKIRREHVPPTGGDIRVSFFVGQTFGSKEGIRALIEQLAVTSRRQLKLIKNDSMRIRAVCMGAIPCKPDEKCPWVLLISKGKFDNTWMVKTFKDTHTCIETRFVRACTASYLSTELTQTLLHNPDMPTRSVQIEMQKKYQMKFSRMKAFRAKQLALQKIHGDYSEQYAILRDYLEELQRTNEGTTVKLEVEVEPNPTVETRRFKRLYVCIGALKKGFKAGLRDFLGLDGSFMKGPFPGQILTAVGIDGNNATYPLAYAVVEAETTSSWTWFLEYLRDDLDMETNSNFTFISDRQKVF